MIQNLGAAGALSIAVLFPMLPADLYQEYVNQFTTVDDFMGQLPAGGATRRNFQVIDVSALTIGKSFPGLNETKIVSIKDPATSGLKEVWETDQYVYKGAYYKTWLDRYVQQFDKPWEKFARGLYEEHSLIPELLVLSTMPPHKNVLARPNILVVTGTTATPGRIRGFLTPFRKLTMKIYRFEEKTTALT